MELEKIDFTPVEADNLLMDHIQDWYSLTFLQLPPQIREQVQTRHDERRSKLIKLIAEGLKNNVV